MVVFTNVQKENVKKLLTKGFLKEEPKTLYEEIRLSKKGVNLIFYNSGKLLLQGKSEAVETIAKQLDKVKIGERTIPEPFRRETGWIIGSDESLKGDTFGGLTVAAVKANKEIREKLREIGVADSKTLKDGEIISMAEKIKRIAPCEIKVLLPEEYNKGKGITHLLNTHHKEVAKDLGTGKHIVDKYPGCAVGDSMLEKAESKYIEVAAASILARAAAVQQIDYLSMQAGFQIPKGSTHVTTALHELKEKKKDFTQFVKVDFKNVREFL